MENGRVIWARRVFWGIVAAIATYAAYLSRAQFLLWHADAEGAARLLPPYHGMGYFLRYAFVHFWFPYVISLIMGGLFFVAAKWLNARRGEMLFEKEELYFLAMGIFVSGHPAWIFYLLVVFSAYLLATLIGAVAYGAHARISFYYFWLPCAVVTVALDVYLDQYAWYVSLVI